VILYVCFRRSRIYVCFDTVDFTIFQSGSQTYRKVAAVIMYIFQQKLNLLLDAKCVCFVKHVAPRTGPPQVHSSVSTST